MRSKPIDVLVVVPPTLGRFRCSLSSLFPAYTPVDSVPLRLAAVIEKYGYGVAFLPLGAMFIHYNAAVLDKVREQLARYRPKCAVIATDYHIGDRGVSTFKATVDITTMMAGLWPGIPLFYAGKLAGTVRGRVLQEAPHLSATFAGEPENYIEEIMAYLLGRINKAPGIAAFIARRKGRIVDPGGFEYVADVDALPLPAYHLLEGHLDTISAITRRSSGIVDISLRTSYGCPYSCHFCANTPHWRQVRTRSPRRIAADIDAMKATLGGRVRLAWFDDELFVLGIDRLREVADLMEERDLRVAGLLMTVDRMTDEVAGLLARFTDSVLFGAENSVPPVLRRVNKAFAGQHLPAAIDTAKRHGLSVRLEWIVGLPGEDWNTALHNLNTMFNLIFTDRVDSIQPYILTPDPGSELAENPEKYGLVIRQVPLADMGHNQNFPIYDLDHLTARQIFLYHLMAVATTSQAVLFRSVYQSAGLRPPISIEGNAELFRETISKFA